MEFFLSDNDKRLLDLGDKVVEKWRSIMNIDPIWKVELVVCLSESMNGSLAHINTTRAANYQATINLDYDLFSYEKKFIDGMALMNTPALVAGQILENMVNQTSPSRSEVAHLCFLMENSFSGVVLSDETAIGKFPVKAVKFCSDYFEYMAC